ncbi:MAG: glycerophosphoryl diester phosphodiesterase membrane domain-containing protein [Candidatus Magasanikbacteria bacterium]|nr:glycerophosphoryl diester phosphodiesterase membrane domain-containing protein [Candidatus Magasanikbacteria bacterium]
MLLSPIDILKEGLAIYQANYKTFFKTIVWFLGAAILLILLNIFDRQTEFKYIGFTFSIYLILTAFSFVIGLWTQIVLIRLINAGLTKETIEKNTLQQNAWRDTVPFLWVSILTGLIILGGSILLIIPGLIFTIWYFFSIYVFSIEGTRGFPALQKSKDLVQGRFWAVVWRIFLPNFLFGLILAVIIGVPTLIIGYFTKFAEFNSSLTMGPWWFDAIQSLATILTLPLSIALTVILYKNLKDNKPTTPTTTA